MFQNAVLTRQVMKQRKWPGNPCCSFCKDVESSQHLFFTCPFARAVWIAHPWFIKSEILSNNYDSIVEIINALLNSGHPHASLINIMIFRWCIWKARNNTLFDRKETKPIHAFQIMQAILDNQELTLQSQ